MMNNTSPLCPIEIKMVHPLYTDVSISCALTDALNETGTKPLSVKEKAS